MSEHGQFKSYKTDTGTLGREAITDRSRVIEKSLKNAGLSNPFSLYEALVTLLSETLKFDVRPLSELMQPVDRNKVRVSLRHDLDSLLPSGLRAARLLQKAGLAGSFYFLHTSYYYGEVKENVFLRQPGFKSFLEDFCKTGCETGLHIDPLNLYFEHGIDGLEAVRGELLWLRQSGAHIEGVVAHNSAVVYGAENFEIFQGMALNGRRELSYNGTTVPLQSIGLKELDLQYEGNFPLAPDPDDSYLLDHYINQTPADCLRRPDWQSIYFLHNPVFSRSNDISIWLVGNNQWVVAEHRPVRRLYANITNIEMFDLLDRIPAGRRIVIVIHPEYIA